jgi:pilus assembly protein CpaE
VLAAPVSTGHTTAAAEFDGHKLSRLLTRMASLHEFVVVDTPPGLSETAAAALDASAFSLLVTTPEVAALRRTQAYIRLLSSLEYPMDKVQVVLNRAQSKTGIRDNETEGILGMPIAWRIANDYAAMEAAAHGRPVVTGNPRSPLARSIRGIARQIAGLDVESARSSRWRAWLPAAATGLAAKF